MMSTLASPTRRGPARNSTVPSAGCSGFDGRHRAWAGASSLAGNGNSSHGSSHDGSPVTPGGAGAAADGTSGNIVSITVPSCFGADGMTGTLDVAVMSGPFTFDVWVTDHVPGDSDWTEIPGSRQTLTVQVSSAAVPFGPLSVAAHRVDVNSYRVETSV
jgi:hypothetical protein